MWSNPNEQATGHRLVPLGARDLYGGEYREIFDLFGEYYVPRLSYRSNCVFRNNPFENAPVKSALQAWGSLCERLRQFLPDIPTGPLKEFVGSVCDKDRAGLARRADGLHTLLGGRVTVLPTYL